MRSVLYPLFLIAALSAVSARADEGRWRGEVSLDVGYLIAGGGPTAPSTGGAAIVPTGRLLYGRPVADPYVAASPMVVAPYSLKALAFVGAFSLGVAWHGDARTWSVGTGATVAPSYMRFCNQLWCLKEGVLLYGGEVHLAVDILRGQGGVGLRGHLSARLLTGRPTAWFWPRLAPEQAAISHLAGMAGGSMAWRF